MARTTAPAGTETLAQGDDLAHVTVAITYEDYGEGEEWVAREPIAVKWAEVFKVMGPIMLDEADDEQLMTALIGHIRQNHSREIREAVNGEV